jgi:acyl-CoA synthetase (AMP-forming)/AMP-acid ligase II
VSPTTTGQTVDIADRVREIALADPDRVALIHASKGWRGRVCYRRHTYRELSDRAEALAVGLREIGVAEGTLCSFMVPPSLDAMVLGIALWRIGAVVVGIEPHSHGLRSVARSLAKVGPEVFFGTPRAHAGRLAFGWGRGTVRTNVMVGRVGRPGVPTLRSLERHPVPGPVPGPPAEPVRGAISPADPAVIAFTTGSTGAPKPTVLRQRNLAAMMAMVLGHWGYTDGREVVDMTTFPMFWIIGLSAGGTVVVPPMDFTLKGPDDADPAPLVRTIRDCGVRSLFASPALLTNLAEHAEGHGITLPTLERIVAGGAEVPGPLFDRVKQVLGPGGEMYSDYGATEALPVTEIAGSDVVGVGGTWTATEKGAGVCVGRPLPGVEVRIVAVADDPIPTWTDATELPVGEIGEVVARSPHISEEYHRQPGADEDNKIGDLGGSWHRIGDLGYLDADGRLWLCGRRSHRVVTDRGVAYPPVHRTRLQRPPRRAPQRAGRRRRPVGTPPGRRLRRAARRRRPHDGGRRARARRGGRGRHQPGRPRGLRRPHPGRSPPQRQDRPPPPRRRPPPPPPWAEVNEGAAVQRCGRPKRWVVPPPLGDQGRRDHTPMCLCLGCQMRPSRLRRPPPTARKISRTMTAPMMAPTTPEGWRAPSSRSLLNRT